MLAVTIDNVMSWEPCKEYSRERVTALFAGREAITALDVLEMDIPAEDRLWAVLRMVPDPILHEFACRRAEAALSQESMAGREPDPRSWAAIDAKRKWLRGEIDGKELYAAREAAQDAAWCAAMNDARYAAWHAARYAAWYAARNAAWDAARGTAFSVAWNSAWNAARNASWSAAWDAAREEQCVMLRMMLEEARRSGTGDAK